MDNNQNDRLDLTGKPARFDGAKLGKRISWQAFAQLTRTPRGEDGHRDMVEVEPHQYVTATVAEALELTHNGVSYTIAEAVIKRPKGCPIPEGAILRPRQPRPPARPRLVDQFWLGRKCVFPVSRIDPTRPRKTWPVTPALLASKPLRALLKPLSATATARHAIATVRAPVAVPGAPVARRNPLAEEHTAERIDGRLMSAADWFQRDILASASARVNGVRMRSPSGEMAPCGSRNPLDLWPAEASADRAIRLRWRFRTLGPLARIVWRALQGEEMADLAPAWPFPQRHKAEAGRIRLRAGLELCARMAEREADRLPQWEVLQVAQAACAECTKLEATRRMRVLIPANDNTPQRIVA